LWFFYGWEFSLLLLLLLFQSTSLGNDYYYEFCTLGYHCNFLIINYHCYNKRASRPYCCILLHAFIRDYRAVNNVLCIVFVGDGLR
jgi:hypothetical protein